MPRYFFDTSAFTKRYHPEVGSARVRAIFQSPHSRLSVSTLTVLEAQSAFAGKVRTEVILPVDADVAMDQIFMEIASGLVEIVSLEDVHLDNARTLVRKYGYLRRMKTLDAIQLALALDMHRTGELDVFVAADKLLAELAAFEGLTVEDPENTP